MTRCDVLVVGAGPAGSGAARLLSAWGHSVLMVDRPCRDERSLAESIPPSARKVLAALGMLTALEDAGWPPWQGNVVWWSPGSPASDPRLESFPPGDAGFHVVRRTFDGQLRALAAESGATVERGVVRDVRVPGVGSADGAGVPRVTIETDAGVRDVEASIVLDCSGRAGVLARQGLRRADSSHQTVALVGDWQEKEKRGRDSFSLSGQRKRVPTSFFSPDFTLVAAHTDGWAWAVPAGPGRRQITVMVDPKRTSLARGVPAAEVYRDALAKVTPFGALVAGGSLADGPWGADASVYSADRFAGPGFLLVGDAASFIDPLSSFGVKKALVSGWLAAIVAHTALARPEMRDAALAFFDRRERAVYATARQQAAAFAAGVAAETGHPFWVTRAQAPEELDPDAEVDAAALARDPQILAAFDDLRRRPAVHFRTGDAAAIRPRAAVRGREIVMEDHVFLPDWPHGLRYIRGVDLVTLVRLAPAFQDVGDLAEAYAREHGPVALPDCLGAIATLVAKGGLAYR